jgi:hypothetical protein
MGLPLPSDPISATERILPWLATWYYTIQAISKSKKTLHRGIIKPSQLSITVKTKQK